MNLAAVSQTMSSIQESITSSSPHSFNSFWRFRGLMEHAKKLQKELKNAKWQRDNKIAFHLLSDFQILSVQLYDRLLNLLIEIDSENMSDEQKKTKEHQLVNKLLAEFDYIETLTSTAWKNDDYFSKERETSGGIESLSWFDNLVLLASGDLGVDPNGILVLFNLYKPLGLRSFTYSKEFLTLDVPVATLYTPWEWSLLWHEIAGYKVKIIKSNQPNLFKDFFEKLKDKIGSDWKEGYIEEIFEDACSVRVFGSEFIPIFEEILNREYAQAILVDDDRHPPAQTRINIAKLLLDQEAQNASDEQKIVTQNMLKDFSAYLPSQKGMFDESDPHKIILQAQVAYKEHPEQGEKIFEDARKQLKMQKIARSEGQTLVSQKSSDENMVSIGIGGQRLDLYNKFTTNANKVEEILSLKLSESDFAALTSHQKNEFGKMSITVHGKTHVFKHKRKNHKN